MFKTAIISTLLQHLLLETSLIWTPTTKQEKYDRKQRNTKLGHFKNSQTHKAHFGFPLTNKVDATYKTDGGTNM